VKKLFVGNLKWGLSDEDLKQTFESCGVVKEAKVITDRDTGKSRGFGFVTMENDEDADKAINAFNGKDIGGRALVVNEARERSSGGGGGGGQKNH
jgi:RNA recognition motif-containing protein